MHDATWQDENRPRVVIWQLTQSQTQSDYSINVLTQKECSLIIESIASVSKPIVIFTGPSLSKRPDLYDIVGFGTSLGLKMIIELTPDELTQDIKKKFRRFGTRIFRIIIDDCIVEDMDSRYKQSTKFLQLENTVRQMKADGFEVHYSITVTQPDTRKLGYILDYAFRSNAQGLYCHLRFDKSLPEITIVDDEPQSLDEFIGKISEMKSLVPCEMYFSPHCVKYSSFQYDDQSDFDFSRMEHPRWIHYCVAGKSYAYIAEDGKLYVCGTRCIECGDLRQSEYNFKRIWSDASIFQILRTYKRTCVQTRLMFKRNMITRNEQDEIITERIKVEP